jgi:hypothetical protein
MAPKSSSSLGKPHLGPEDFNEGPAAAARFKAAVGYLAALPKSEVSNAHHHSKAKHRKKK